MCWLSVAANKPPKMQWLGITLSYCLSWVCGLTWVWWFLLGVACAVLWASGAGVTAGWIGWVPRRFLTLLGSGCWRSPGLPWGPLTGACTLLRQLPRPPHTAAGFRPKCSKTSGWTLGRLMTYPLKSQHVSPFLLAKGPLRPAQVPGGEWQGSCGLRSLPQLLLECGKDWLQAWCTPRGRQEDGRSRRGNGFLTVDLHVT